MGGQALTHTANSGPNPSKAREEGGGGGGGNARFSHKSDVDHVVHRDVQPTECMLTLTALLQTVAEPSAHNTQPLTSSNAYLGCSWCQ